MRIAFYAPLKAPDHPTASGDRLIARLLVRALERAGHEVVVASRLRTFDGAGDRRRQLRLACSAREETRRLLDEWLDAPQAPWCWLTYHLYHKAPDWIGPRVSAGLGIPYLVAEASYAPKQARGAWRHGHRAVAAALSHASRLIALNPDDIPGLERFFGGTERIRRLAPFLDTGVCAVRGERSRRRVRIARLAGVAPSVALLACVAMMRSGRKVDSFKRLARALERVTHVPWHLLAIGDGPARDEVETAFARLGAAGRVTFLGPRSPPMLYGIVSACDLFAWPALGEPIGMAMLEAQSLGVPVVAGDGRGVGAVVVHGAGGWLVPEGDTEAFATAVVEALADPVRLGAAGSAARARVRAEHGIEAAARDLDRWIGEAVAENGRDRWIPHRRRGDHVGRGESAHVHGRSRPPPTAGQRA